MPLFRFIGFCIRIYSYLYENYTLFHTIKYFTPHRVRLMPTSLHQYPIGYKFFLVKSSVLKINVKKIKKIVDN